MTRQRLFLWVIPVLLATILAGCGDDSSGEPTAAPSEATPTSVAEDASTGPSADEVAPSGSGTGTLTVDDGTVYSFSMSTCDTSENSTSFAIDPGYDLFGKSEDGFTMQFIRAGFDEDSARTVGGLEGDFDENGVNPKVSYNADPGQVNLVVDGGHVAGSVTMDSFEESVHGREIEATVDISC